MAMADVFLRHRKDKASYIKCYLDLVVSGGTVWRDGALIGD